MSNSAVSAFEDDAAFLSEHHQTIVLTDDAGRAKVVVVPDFQARVMTSTDGASGLSFGWINRDLIASGKRVPHMHPFGGEDRFWLGPEGGQFSIFFKEGDPFDLDHWQTPAPLDTDRYDLQTQSTNEAVFMKTFDLVNYSGTPLRIGVKRTIRVLEPATALPGVSVPTGISMVAFETENTITNAGQSAWTEQGGLLSIWILSMLKATPQTTVAVPFRPGPVDSMGPVVNADYFGRVPDERLKVGDRTVFFKGDARHRSKIGVAPARAKDTLGSFDAQNGVLTLARFTLPGDTSRYVNSMWEVQAEPFAGDVVNSYNDGPPPGGGAQLGQFYELESSSPALSLAPGESATHHHMTLHAAGDPAGLDALARHALGVRVEEIRQALR